MAETFLYRAGVVPVVGELIAAGMAQHVRMDSEAELCPNPGTVMRPNPAGSSASRART